MTATRELFLARVEDYLDRTGMGHSYFGRKANAGGSLVKRLRAGEDIGTRTMDKVLEFMAANPPPPRTAGTEKAEALHNSQ